MSTPTHEAEELQEKIARLLGWKPDHSGWWLAPDGSQGQPPPVAFDLGAALALCLDIGARHEWAVLCNSHHGTDYSARFMRLGDGMVWEMVHNATFCATAALALAELALAALEDEVQP